ncbi:MAG: hypothetical protein KAR42_03575 [candidate division Zixibacteria bacterium]|nr:hypothetical protein [candidate division Zixibacteria bacterium]
MNSKRPTWVTVIGVLTIIFGIFGIFGTGQIAIMPFVMDFQKDIIDHAVEQARHDRHAPEELLKSIQDMMDYPPWFKSTSVIFGLIGMLISAFYLFAGIWFIQVKPSADKLLIYAISLSILWEIVWASIIGIGLSGFAVFMVIGTLFGFVIDMVLLAVVTMNDRSIFRKSENPIDGNYQLDQQ